jgi:hypothetical protein
MRFISDDDCVLLRAQAGHLLALLGEKLLNRGEDHAAARHGQQLAQLVAARGLHGRLAEDVRAALELAEKLIVEVVAVGQHDERRVLHRGLADHAGGEEEHRKTLAAALRVPDHTRATVARLAAAHLPGPVTARRFLAQHVAGAHPAGAHRFLDGERLQLSS